MPAPDPPQSTEAMLRACGVCKRYGSTVALDHVDLMVDRGEIVALLGPNGAGKTTFVSIVSGLRRADAGTIWVGGFSVSEKPRQVRRLLGLAPQETGVYPVLTVQENLRFFGELAGCRGQPLRRRIKEVASALRLDELLSRRVRFLSGGERRRLHTATALLHEPALLVLDEPTAGVDVETRSAVLEVVRQTACNGAAVCYTTHYLSEVETLNARATIIDEGRIVADGTVPDLIRRAGRSMIELHFDGTPPDTNLGFASEIFGQTIRVYADDPTTQAGLIVTKLGPAAELLRSLEIVTPSLESVFLTLTGRRYNGDSCAYSGGVGNVSTTHSYDRVARPARDTPRSSTHCDPDPDAADRNGIY